MMEHFRLGNLYSFLQCTTIPYFMLLKRAVIEVTEIFIVINDYWHCSIFIKTVQDRYDIYAETSISVVTFCACSVQCRSAHLSEVSFRACSVQRLSLHAQYSDIPRDAQYSVILRTLSIVSFRACSVQCYSAHPQNSVIPCTLRIVSFCAPSEIVSFRACLVQCHVITSTLSTVLVDIIPSTVRTRNPFFFKILVKFEMFDEKIVHYRYLSVINAEKTNSNLYSTTMNWSTNNLQCCIYIQ